MLTITFEWSTASLKNSICKSPKEIYVSAKPCTVELTVYYILTLKSITQHNGFIIPNKFAQRILESHESLNDFSPVK
jgi:hypothetical protein